MRKGAVIAIIIIVILIICGVVGFVIYNNMQNDSSTSNASGYEQKTSAGLGFEEDQSNLEKDAIQGVEIPGWEKMSIEAGKTEVFLSTPFYNPEGNKDKYNMTFELRLADTGEVLYTSGLVAPGSQIKKITLSRPLEAGTYNAVLHVQPYKADTGVATNNADMKFTLIVK